MAIQDRSSISSSTVNQGNAQLNVEDYGGHCDGIADDTDAVLAVHAAAKASTKGKGILIPGFCKVSTTIALDSTYSGISLWGRGGNQSGIIKAFDGDLYDLTGVLNFEVHHLHIDGQYGTHVGKGFVLSGNCNNPIFSFVDFLGLSDSHIEFGPNAGYNAKIVATNHFTGPGQGDFRTVCVTGQDTTATPRKLLGVDSNGYHQFHGAFDTKCIGCFATRYETDSNCSIVEIAGSTWADQANFNLSIPITMYAVHMEVTACRIANTVVLAAGSSGAFTGNHQSGVIAGTEPLTDNSGGTWSILHQDGVKAKTYLGGGLFSSARGGEFYQVNHVPVGDANIAITTDTNNSFGYHTPLTANRTVTIDLTNGREGQIFHFVRDGGDTGGPWHVSLGATGISMLNNQWFDLIYNGSYLEKMRSGALI